jgi:hypothetical protein
MHTKTLLQRQVRNCLWVAGLTGKNNSAAKAVSESCSEKMLLKIRVARASEVGWSAERL